MEFLDIRFFEFIRKKDSILQFKRRSDHALVSAIAFPEFKSTSDVHEAFFQNLETLNQISHPNIVKTLGHSFRDTDNGSELIIFIEQSEGTLEDFLESEILSKDDVKSILKDVILTLTSVEEKLNRMPVYLTPRNIIVSKNYFGDNTFKLFCPIINEYLIALKQDYAKWTAPELFPIIRFANNQQAILLDKNSIIYSLGLISIFMITGDENLIQPRESSNFDQYSAQIKEFEEKNIRRYISETASQLKDPTFMDLILKMLKYNPKDRPTLSEILSKIFPSGHVSTNTDIRDQMQRNSNQEGYGIFVDVNENQANRQNQHAARIPNNNANQNNSIFRIIQARDFSTKTFTFVITTLQIIVFLITTTYRSFTDIPDCTLYYFGASYTPSINVYHQLYRLFTPIFLHANLLHLIMNMTGQYYVGFTLEKFVGIKKFSFIYLVSGICGNLMATSMNTQQMGVGASTSLFGLFHLQFLHDIQNMNIRDAEKNYVKNLIFCFLFSLLPGISFYGHLGGWIGGVLTSTIVMPVHPNHGVLLKLKPKAMLILVIGAILSLIYILTLKGLEQQALQIDYACHSFF